MNKKLLILGSSILCASLLNGCATAYTMSEISDGGTRYDVKEETLYTDQLIAYGIPKTPVPSYENALAIVGTKNNYLIEPIQTTAPNQNVLVDIVTQLDLTYLSIAPRVSSGANDKNFEITIYDPKASLSEMMLLRYAKPNLQVTSKEKQLLQSLQFSCSVPVSTNNYVCEKNITYRMYAIKKDKNQAPPQYTFRQPIQLKVNLSQKIQKRNFSKAPYLLLLPLAVVVDIVTLPIQFIGFSQALSNGH